MVRIPHGQRERPLIRLGEQAREIVAAWFVVLLILAAGLSFLSIQRHAPRHCPTILAMPSVLHRPLVVTEDWGDPACSSGRCGYMLSVHEHDDESGGAAERDDDPAAAYSGKQQLPLDPIANTGKEQRELLCS
jgi:hypothetical protein